jgi:hypothetical protein
MSFVPAAERMRFALERGERPKAIKSTPPIDILSWH